MNPLQGLYEITYRFIGTDQQVLHEIVRFVHVKGSYSNPDAGSNTEGNQDAGLLVLHPTVSPG